VSQSGGGAIGGVAFIRLTGGVSRCPTIDMSEYMEKHTVSRLVGAPPGRVDFDEGGTLTGSVRRHPHQVILFDEVEKAHEVAFEIILQVINEGRLTDGQGRTANFSDSIIVLTSKLGSQSIAELSESADLEAARPAVMQAVRDWFRPKFPDRLDEIVLFRSLARADMAAIVDIHLSGLRRRLSDRKITLELDVGAREWLAETGSSRPSEPPCHPPPTCRLVGGSNTTVMLWLPQARQIRRDTRRESGKFGPGTLFQ
jgi:ATP-dependent Clp protease ATP-binding subunit ClpA